MFPWTSSRGNIRTLGKTELTVTVPLGPYIKCILILYLLVSNMYLKQKISHVVN